MNGADIIIKTLHEQGCNDFWGIPGGVVLEFMYAAQRDEIHLHLSYHEQCAVFAAMGYSQASENIGVAYVTRGPGITNAITALADAYYESVPVIVLTAHTQLVNSDYLRIETDQELDSLYLCKKFTKYAARIENSADLVSEISKSIFLAKSGRKGPVLLDVAVSILYQSYRIQSIIPDQSYFFLKSNSDIKNILFLLNNSKRPVFLIGNGIKQSDTISFMRNVVQKYKIPVISSRSAEDIIPDSPYYYGYVGSHGIRAANFIISKADCIISLGNRLSFPVSSESYLYLLNSAKWIRVDIDESELKRDIPNVINIKNDLRNILPCLLDIDIGNFTSWINICNKIRSELYNFDLSKTIIDISDILKELCPDNSWISCDVGNNEFQLSRAYLLSKSTSRIVYSKSLGVLGNAIGKAIGIYFGSHKKVICIMGDQGFQMNIQELQAVRYEKIPVKIIIINNKTSAMIRDTEKRQNRNYLQVSDSNGYMSPNIKGLAEAYNIKYIQYTGINSLKTILDDEAAIIEVPADAEEMLMPTLPRGRKIYDMSPDLNKDLLSNLASL
jgi:acetolactate synthase I/II/III large subunit